MRRLLIATGAALVLTGCGEDRVADEGNAQVRIANPHHEELSALPPALQRLGLMRAIRDTRNRCRRVEAGRFQQDYRGMKMWVALCDDGKHWMVFIAANGDVQVRDCAQARQLDLPQCRPISGPGS